MKKILSLLIVLAFISFLIGCGGGEKKAEKPSEEVTEEVETMAEAGGYQAMTVTNGGTIKGTVTFAGTIPPKQKLEITKDVNVCGKMPHYKEDLVVSRNKGVANVVVSITTLNKGKSMDVLGNKFELDQNGCTFKPHVVIVPTGTDLTILNSDGILHNIHTFSEKNTPINVAQPGFKKKMTQTFNEPEVIRVACDVHNWMDSYIIVVEHPYYAVTNENGNFELTDVPAGTYTLEYWQETLGTRTAEVTVTEGAVVEANFEFAAGTASASL
ncbi:MAG: carboxypeptidase regulatory-like domain-containing protein [bacterium]